jgi:hypothetical protein
MVVFSNIWMNFLGKEGLLCDSFCGLLCSLNIKGGRRVCFSPRSVYGSQMNSRIGLFMTLEFLFSCSYLMKKEEDCTVLQSVVLDGVIVLSLGYIHNTIF